MLGAAYSPASVVRALEPRCLQQNQARRHDLVERTFRPDRVDLAVQAGLHKIMELDARPSEKQARALAEDWSPHRGAAALLTWHVYNNPAL